jgi:hypothetical protein
MDDPDALCALAAQRGGRLQRAAQRQAAELRRATTGDLAAEAATGRSFLAQELLQMWSWGSLTAFLVQKLALAAVRDGTRCTALTALSSLGARGEQPGNVHRDLVRLVGRWFPPAAEPVVVSVPLQRAKHSPVIETALVPYLPLHSQLHAAHLRQPHRWSEHVLGGFSDCLPFWSSLKGDDPRLQSFRPVLRQKCVELRCTELEALRRCLPLALHADGVPCSKGNRLLH